MYQDLDQKGFELLNLLEPREAPAGAPKSEKPLKVGEAKIIDLGEVSEMKISSTDYYGTNVSAFQSIDKGMIGLPQEKYKVFSQLVTDIHERSPFDEKATYSFIEKHAFDWLIDVYKEKRAAQSLTSFLLSKVDEEYGEYTYYFKLHPLILESPFQIGNTAITFFTDEFLQQEEAKFLLSGSPKKNFDDFFKEFKNTALVKITKPGVQQRAAELAIQQAELVADILRCLLQEYGVMNQHALPDIDHRVKPRKAAVHIYNYQSDSFTFAGTVSNHGPVIPIEINEKLLEEFKRNKLPLFEKFIAGAKDNDFYYAIREAIGLFSELITIQNKYDKIVKLISLFEGIVIDKNGKRGHGETIIKLRLMPKMLTENDIKLGSELTSNFYRIRDAYIHHRVEKHVDFHKLYQFQTIGFRFLWYLMRLNDSCNSMEEFYELHSKE